MFAISYHDRLQTLKLIRVHILQIIEAPYDAVYPSEDEGAVDVDDNCTKFVTCLSPCVFLSC